MFTHVPSTSAFVCFIIRSLCSPHADNVMCYSLQRAYSVPRGNFLRRCRTVNSRDCWKSALSSRNLQLLAPVKSKQTKDFEVAPVPYDARQLVVISHLGSKVRGSSLSGNKFSSCLPFCSSSLQPLCGPLPARPQEALGHVTLKHSKSWLIRLQLGRMYDNPNRNKKNYIHTLKRRGI
jgi:hypothetical protein